MKLFLWSFFSLALNHSRRVVVSNKRKYVLEVVQACPGKRLGELTVPP